MGLAVPSRARLHFLHTQAESEFTLTGFLPIAAVAFIYVFKPPYAIGSVPSLSDHAIAYRRRSLPRVYRHRVSVGIAYTEQRENHGSMILDGVCYFTLIQFCRVTLSRMIEPYHSQSFFDEFCLVRRVFLSLGVYRRPCVSAINAMLLVQYVM